MRIGVICEGETDYIGIENFLGGALAQRGIDASFIPIQPNPDNTLGGGWTRVLYWLEANPLQSRLKSLFGAGLFGGNLSGNRCDVLVIQMDTDILGDGSFETELTRLGVIATNPASITDRGQEIERILVHLSQIDNSTEVDKKKHIFSPTVESGETWCVAAFQKLDYDPEALQGQSLRDAFGSVLAGSEGRPATIPYGAPNKSKKRRRKFCNRHKNSNYIEIQALHFRQLVDRVVAIQD